MRSLLPRKWSLANAKPASVLKRTTEKAMAPETIAELISAVQKLMLTSPELKTRLMLRQSSLPGVVTGGYAAVAELSCDATPSRNRYVRGPADSKRRVSVIRRLRLRAEDLEVATAAMPMSPPT